MSVDFDFAGKASGKLLHCEKCGFKHAYLACYTSLDKVGMPLSLVNPNIYNYQKSTDKVKVDEIKENSTEDGIFLLCSKDKCFYCERKS